MSITLAQAILLGVVQGLTEFLPVSSTAHLALAQRFMPGFSQPGILFDVLLHVGTLLAVTVFFRKRILSTAKGLGSADDAERRAARRLFGLILLAVALTGAVALPLKKLAVEGMSDFRRIGWALLGTALLLLVAQIVGKRRGEGGRPLEQMKVGNAALVGICQSASAVLHGLSRSGNTISVGLFTGLSREAAAEFSFLLSIPTILAAAFVENWHAYRHNPGTFSAPGAIPTYLVGMVVAAFIGYFAVGALLRVVIRMHLLPFAIYCAALGLFLVVAPPI
jgi:undecaprenyl-diphosphatase